jgi:hypothetical protein
LWNAFCTQEYAWLSTSTEADAAMLTAAAQSSLSKRHYTNRCMDTTPTSAQDWNNQNISEV